MSSRKQVGTNLLGRNKELVKLQVIVAETARNRSTAREIFVNKRTNDVALEPLLMVHYIVRNTKMLGYMASVVNVLD